jgi:flagellar hook-associated protein FlgK
VAFARLWNETSTNTYARHSSIQSNKTKQTKDELTSLSAVSADQPALSGLPTTLSHFFESLDSDEQLFSTHAH